MGEPVIVNQAPEPAEEAPVIVAVDNSTVEVPETPSQDTALMITVLEGVQQELREIKGSLTTYGSRIDSIERRLDETERARNEPPAPADLPGDPTGDESEDEETEDAPPADTHFWAKRVFGG